MSTEYSVTVSFLLAAILGSNGLPLLMGRILTSVRTEDVIIGNNGDVMVSSTPPALTELS